MLKILVEMNAIMIVTMGMKAANLERDTQGGEALAYGEDAFNEKADELRALITNEKNEVGEKNV